MDVSEWSNLLKILSLFCSRWPAALLESGNRRGVLFLSYALLGIFCIHLFISMVL